MARDWTIDDWQAEADRHLTALIDSQVKLAEALGRLLLVEFKLHTLLAKLARAREALEGFAINDIDPRLSYVEVQIDREDLALLNAALASENRQRCPECAGTGWFSPTAVRADGWLCIVCGGTGVLAPDEQPETIRGSTERGDSDEAV